MVRFLAHLMNGLVRLRLPLPAGLLFAMEQHLWARPDTLPLFLTAVNPAALWKVAEAKLIALVNRHLSTTPALQQVQAQHFPGRRIRSIAEFRERFPILDKANYIRNHTLAELCQGGRLPHAGSFYKSAGTSGNPTLWVESLEEELALDKAVAFIGAALIDATHHDYVILNCWALGSWPTGINFAASSRLQGKMVNVGTNTSEALELLTLLGPRHRYLLAGYPPFIYHLIQEAKGAGLPLRDYHIDVVSGGEGFVEEWRDALLTDLGPRTIFSVYGSTDKGLGEGVETTLAYLVRSLLYIAATTLVDHWRAVRVMELRFGTNTLPFTPDAAQQFLIDFLKREEDIARLPMIFQFDPTQYYSENFTRMDPVQNREVPEFLTTVLSSHVTIPRVRYNIHDEGFMMRYEEVMEILTKHGIALAALNVRSDPHLDLHLPFLFIFGRSDGTVSLDGANIFPEDVEQCLRQDAELFATINSFQLSVTPDYHLGVALELLPAAEPDPALAERFTRQLTAHLAEYSFGYAELVRDRLPSAAVVVQLHRMNEGPFAERNLKLRYVQH